MYIESKVNKLIKSLLKNILLAVREESIKMAVMFIMNPDTPTAHNTIPLIQYRNIETIVLSISENSGQKASVEIFILDKLSPKNSRTETFTETLETFNGTSKAFNETLEIFPVIRRYLRALIFVHILYFLIRIISKLCIK